MIGGMRLMSPRRYIEPPFLGDMMINKMRFLIAGLVVAVCLSFLIVVEPTSSADRLRVGLSSFTPINAAIWIAEDKGLFKKHGIDAEVVLIGGASAGGVSSLIAGDIQFLGGAGGAVISAGLNGADVIMVASIVNRGVQRVMARSDLGSRRTCGANGSV
jgi:ABC-type nitrate/sulfonate/bicarbonate transport system substrate-binding protein